MFSELEAILSLVSGIEHAGDHTGDAAFLEPLRDAEPIDSLAVRSVVGLFIAGFHLFDIGLDRFRDWTE